MTLRCRRPAAALAALLLVLALPGAAPVLAETDAKLSDSPAEKDLTPEERAEREQRKSCKVAMCAALRVRKTDGADIACDIVKSWRKEQLTKLVAKLKVAWPYAGVRCSSAVNVKRADLVTAMTVPKYELQLQKHSVACAVSRDAEAATDIKFDFSPKVTFEDGKATKAQINWGKIEAPALVKSALWTATAADNTVNLLSGTLVDDINDFVSKKCDEVENEWSGKSR